MQTFHHMGDSSLPRVSIPGVQRYADNRMDPLEAARRARWLAACADRLVELRPEQDAEAQACLAEALWDDLGNHDPVIAAEMEHEGDLGE